MNYTITLKKQWVFLLFLIAGSVYGQTPVITSFSPTTVTYRTSVTINGTGFTGATAANVKFAGIAATSITVNSGGTQIIALMGSSASTVTGPVTVKVSSITGTSATNGTYIAPSATVAANSKVTRIITDFNGYWSSTSASTDPSQQPDTDHSLMAFQYGGVIYSTGSTTSTNLLNTHGITYTAGNYRSLPINNLIGNVPSGSSNPNLIVLGSKIDGDASTQVPTAPTVAGLSVRDVLIDGIRGLNLGTGVTNLPSNAVLLFNASNIISAGINDNVPDIIVSQIADPSDSSFSVYSFTDTNGNIVGNPIQVALNAIPAVGRYKSDFFTLPTGSPLNSAVVNGSTTIGASTRDIRLVAYKLSDFGINDSNKGSVAYFKVMPSGTSDPAWLAYNRDAFQIPSPIITSQPQSQVACTGAGNNVTFTVTATGEELEYQWEKNGVALTDGGNISGATTASLTISNVQESDVAAYRVTITNSGGAAFSEPAYLNTMITLQPADASTCQGTAVTLQTMAGGASLSYQWYSNATNSNSGGTLIAGATGNTYSPPVTTAGTNYYYAIISNSGQSCAAATTDAAAVTVSSPSSAGTTSPDQTACYNSPAMVSISGYSGSIQWQQSADGSTGWANVTGGSGATTATYTTGNLTSTTYYRAVVTNGACSAVSNTVKVTVTNTDVWTGEISTEWNTPGNWACGVVPDLTLNAQIPVVTSGNYPVITGEYGVADCKNLSIDSGASVTVTSAGSGTLRSAGTISNNGTLDVTDGTMVMMGSVAQTLPADAFESNTIRNLTIYNTNQVTLNGSLNLTGILSLQTGLFDTSNTLTLKSNASTTAVIDDVHGSITGEMTIERYIPARRAFRFISSPTTGGSIQSNWQEGMPSTDPEGLGTDITGTGAADNGFDESGSNNPSLFTHNNTTSEWEAVTSTFDDLIAGVPYRLMVRGDRTVNQYSNSSPASNTTLRMTGTIVTGDVTVTDLSAEAGKFSFVGNPYQAPVDMEAVLSDATNLNTDYYYVWDPTRNTRGSYVTVNVVANSNNVSGSVAGKYLEPNHAFFVQTLSNAEASLTFTEADKFIMDNSTPALYRSDNNQPAQIRLSMSTAAAYAENGPTADGFVVLFDNAYTNNIDNKDAVKPVNLDENVGTVNSGQTFSFESRAMPTITDVIPMHNDNYRTTDYVYSVTVSGLGNTTPYLHDKYNDSMTELADGQTTTYSFSIDPANGASSAPDRFEILFEDSALANTTFGPGHFSIYPNPVTGNSFNILLPDTKKTGIRLFNSIGQEIKCRITNNGKELIVYPESELSSGVYIVQLNQGNKITSQKLIVK